MPARRGQAERHRRWPKVAYYERLGRSKRPDIEVQPAKRLTHVVKWQSSDP
jgi:hypothetical protein